MIYFLGNCQARSLFDSNALGLHDARFFLFYSTVVHSGIGIKETKQKMAQILGHKRLKYYLDNNLIGIQPSLKDLKSYQPAMIVVSMFHERDLYINSTGDQVVYVAPAFKNHDSAFTTWINRDFKKLDDNFFDHSYLTRYEDFLSAIRSLFPNIPIIIIKRLSHFPIFGPRAHSDLLCWAEYWKKFNPSVDRIVQKLHPADVIDIDRIVGGEYNRTHMVEHLVGYPDSRHSLNFKDIFKIDLEHLEQKIWDNVVLKLLEIQNRGCFKYSTEEYVPNDFHCDMALDDRAEIDIDQHIRSVNLQSFRRLVHYFIQKLPEDMSDFIIRHKEYVCSDYRKLFILKPYILANPNRKLLPVLQLYKDVHDKSSKTNGIDSQLIFHTVTELIVRLSKSDTPLLKSLQHAHKILLWGAGGRGCALRKYLTGRNLTHKIHGFADSNPDLWGTQLEGLNIYAPEQVPEVKPDVIIIASIFEQEVRRDISCLRLSENIQLLNSSSLLEELQSVQPIAAYH